MATQLENPEQKVALRDRLVARREALNEQQRRRMDRQICAHLLRFLDERDCLSMAAFHPFRGEPDLMPALEALHHAGRRIYLPVVGPERVMRFHRWRPGGPISENRFGIPEPIGTAQCPIASLEMVLMPLVAFSVAGARLGMGAGFYDRAFAFRLEAPDTGPLLVGAAYGLQEVDNLPVQSWDVPMDAVITDRGLKTFRD
jgi:5-formyltetrahydrofolate cyclo-ligase